MTGNVITGATDGGIVIFGSPGSRIYNNTIINQGAMQLGGAPPEALMNLGKLIDVFSPGINLVDYLPWNGNFNGTIVENNSIMGGFATNLTDPTDNEGKNADDAFIK